jgi:tetratricopeptide (TPR) repeat protein
MNRLQLLLLVYLVVQPGAAHGQDAARAELAKRHYNLGEQLYRTSDYAGALAEFKKSYELARKPELLFNMARCHEVLAQLEEAVAAYEAYFKERPDAPNADLVKSRLNNLRKRLEAKRKKDSEEEKLRRAEDEKLRAEEKRRAEAEQQRQQQPTERPSRWKRTAGWVTLGAGAAALVTGVVFGVMARGKAGEFEDGVGEGKLYYELDEIDGQGKRYDKAALATLIVGGVGVAAGGGLLIWDWMSTRGERRTARLLPFAGGLVAHVSF